MKTIFHWGKFKVQENQRQFFEDKFKDDFRTLFEKKPKEALVFMEQYLPGTLSGSINDGAGKKLYSFDCRPIENYTTTYTKHQG